MRLPSVRWQVRSWNQLACYLREVLPLMEQCKFLWAGIDLIGLHVTMPFMRMLIDHKVAPRMLLEMQPNLYNDRNTYPESLCYVTKCGVPALKPYSLNPCIREPFLYGIDVCKSLADSVD